MLPVSSRHSGCAIPAHCSSEREPVGGGRAIPWHPLDIAPDAGNTMANGDVYHDAAVKVAIRAGLLRLCPIHAQLYDPGQHDFQGAVMMAAYLMNQSDPIVACFQDDRTRLKELLKAICENQPLACPQCTAAAHA